MSSTRRVPVKVIQLLLYVSGCRHLMLTADSPSFPPALSHLQLHLHTEYFTFNQVSVPWMQATHWSCCNPLFSPRSDFWLALWADPFCHVMMQVQLSIQGWWWKGLARVRKENGRTSFSSSSLLLFELWNCAFRAILPTVWITFPESLELGRDVRKRLDSIHFTLFALALAKRCARQ